MCAVALSAAFDGTSPVGLRPHPLRLGLRPIHLPQTPSLRSVEGEEMGGPLRSVEVEEIFLPPAGGVPAEPGRGGELLPICARPQYLASSWAASTMSSGVK